MRSSALPQVLQDFDPKELPADTNAAVAFIESELRRQGLALIQGSEFFVCLVPTVWINSPGAGFLSTLKPPSADSITNEPLTTALFDPASGDQVLKFYSELRSRTLLGSSRLPLPPVILRTQRALTRNQMIYAITVLLALNNIAAVDDGEKFVQVVPVEMLSQVVTNSPKPSANAVVLDPKEVPKFKTEGTPVRINQLNQLYRRFFHDTPPWTPRPVDRLVEFYAELTDQKSVPSKTHGLTPVMFEVTTPLTKEELIYAIETILRLEGLEIAKADKNKIGPVPLGTRPRLDKETTPAAEKR